MHIEPGLVHAAKMPLAQGVAVAAAGWAAKLAADDIRAHGAASFGLRGALAAALTFFCFEVLPHAPVGVSEVHLILGATMLLILGAGPTALGLAGGLAIQSLFFVPTDLPMYAVNVSTLLVALFALDAVARRVIPATTAYVDLRYADVLKLSLAFQGGVVAMVAFWVFYGQGFAVMDDVARFGAVYMLVVIVEPLVELGALAGAKALRGWKDSGVFVNRLHHPA